MSTVLIDNTKDKQESEMISPDNVERAKVVAQETYEHAMRALASFKADLDAGNLPNLIIKVRLSPSVNEEGKKGERCHDGNFATGKVLFEHTVEMAEQLPKELQIVLVSTLMAS